jgi:hypothetical protein
VSGRSGWILVLIAAGLWYWNAAWMTHDRRSATYDEPLHLVGGWTYWRLEDYRLHPTNGPLMQRWLTVPYLLADPHLPSSDGDDFRKATKLGEDYGKRFLLTANDDPQFLLALGRAMNAALGTALALVALFAVRWTIPGAVGGPTFLIVLLCPNIVAHAGLATSDVGAALGFLLAIFCWARLLERVTLGRLFWSVGSWGVLAGIKMSAALLLPIAVIAALPTVLGRRTWRLRIAQHVGWWRSRTLKAFLLLAVLGVHLAGSTLMVWSFYGFRYSAFAPHEVGVDGFTTSWSSVLDGLGAKGSTLQFARDTRLLPEAYLYGFAHTLKYAQKRPAYLNGRYSATGWWYYFPLVFLMKTPLPTLALIALTGWWGLRRLLASSDLRTAAKRRRTGLRAWPFVGLVAVYFLVACASNLNIGYRHLLPILPPLFVLVGGLELARMPLRVASWLLVGWLAVENVAARPYYLSYFNQLAGGRDHGYRRLSDSNVDWGQDLPSLADWIANRRGSGDRTPIYLSYFGVDDPKRFGIDAPEPFASRAEDLSGWYCFSATIFTAPSRIRPIWGDVEERQYQQMLALPPEAIAGDAELERRMRIARQFRLIAGLGKRPPEVNVGGSILIFKASDDEIRHDLFGPPPHR